MRLFYRARQAKRTGEVVYEQTGPVAFCCAEMCRHWLTLIGFGTKDCPCSTSWDVNLYGSVPQANGGAVCLLTPVLYCPFCGEAVEACRAKSAG
jgi:hypothetical protein